MNKNRKVIYIKEFDENIGNVPMTQLKEDENTDKLHTRRSERLHAFCNNTKLIRKQISKQLREALHKRVEISNVLQNETELILNIKIYDYNNFDYENIEFNYKTEISASEYVDTVLTVYKDPKLKQKYIFKHELDATEKLFLTWINSTNMNKYYGLSEDGIIYKLYDKVDSSKDLCGELFIQDFIATYDKEMCILCNNEIGKYILSKSSIKKIS